MLVTMMEMIVIIEVMEIVETIHMVEITPFFCVQRLEYSDLHSVGETLKPKAKLLLACS